MPNPDRAGGANSIGDNMKAMAELKSSLSGDEDGKMGIGRMIQKIFTTSIIFLLLFPISPFTSHEASGVPGTNHSGNSTGVETWTIEDAPHYIIGDFTILIQL